MFPRLLFALILLRQSQQSIICTNLNNLHGCGGGSIPRTSHDLFAAHQQWRLWLCVVHTSRKQKKTVFQKRFEEKWHRNVKQQKKKKNIYIYKYICACCEVIIWAKFGHFRCYYLGQVGIIIWAKLFLAYKNRGFKRFLAHTVIILCSKKGAKIGFFNFLCFKFKIWKFSFFRSVKTL